MSSIIDKEVTIGGKKITLSGTESPEYIQKVADYLNQKIDACSKVDSFKRQSFDMQNVLLQLNIADDYFRSQEMISVFENELEEKEKEIRELKQEMVTMQIKLAQSEQRNRK